MRIDFFQAASVPDIMRFYYKCFEGYIKTASPNCSTVSTRSSNEIWESVLIQECIVERMTLEKEEQTVGSQAF